MATRIVPPLRTAWGRGLEGAGAPREAPDTAMPAGAGWPMGPCALIDLIGIDVHVHASEALHEALGEERMAPPQLLVEMRDAGRLGRKSGQGFFSYET